MGNFNHDVIKVIIRKQITCYTSSNTLPVEPYTSITVIKPVVFNNHINRRMQFNTTDLCTGKLALSMNIIDMIILNHTEYSSHVSTNTCLFAIKDNVITYHMRTDILLVPAHTPGLNNRLYLPVKSHNTLLQCPKIVARSKIFP